MATLPAKFEYGIPQTLNTFAVKDQLKAIGLRYGQNAETGDTTWFAASEEDFQRAMAIVMAAGAAPEPELPRSAVTRPHRKSSRGYGAPYSREWFSSGAYDESGL